MTDAAGAVAKCYDYMPFGESLTIGRPSSFSADGYQQYPVSDKKSVRFTGKERDGEMGLDYFGARYLSGAMGRFVSADPLLASGGAEGPQTWNRYAYVLNNPLRYVDPTGMKEISTEDCQKNTDCVSVPINIIYDRNAQLFDAKGNVQPGVQQKIDDQVAAAKDVHGDSLVSFNLSYSSGEISGKGSDQTVTGTKPRINGVVTDSRDSFVPGGASERNGTALIRVNAGTSDRSTLPHESGHVLAGASALARNCRAFLARRRGGRKWSAGDR